MKKKEHWIGSDLEGWDSVPWRSVSDKPQVQEREKNRIQYLHLTDEIVIVCLQQKGRQHPKRSMPGKDRQSRLSRLQMKALSLLIRIIFDTTAGRSHLMPSLVKSWFCGIPTSLQANIIEQGPRITSIYYPNAGNASLLKGCPTYTVNGARSKRSLSNKRWR